jgi:hypothetical protein
LTAAVGAARDISSAGTDALLVVVVTVVLLCGRVGYMDLDVDGTTVRNTLAGNS